MKREDENILAVKAGFELVGDEKLIWQNWVSGKSDKNFRELIRLVEQATLERAAVEFEEEWTREILYSSKASEIIRSLKTQGE